MNRKKGFPIYETSYTRQTGRSGEILMAPRGELESLSRSFNINRNSRKNNNSFRGRLKHLSTSSRKQSNTYARTNTMVNGVLNCPGVKYIPGFYYDSEKKRYFKITKEHPGKAFILPSCGGCNKASIGDPSQTVRNKRQRPPNVSVVKHIQDRQFKCLSLTPQRDSLEKLSRLLKVRQRLKLDPLALTYVAAGDFAVSRIEPGHNDKRLLTLFEARPSGNQIVQFHDLVKDKGTSLSLVHNMAMVKNQKITGLRWSPHEETQNLYILSLLGHGNMSGETMIFDVSGATQRMVGRCSVQGNSVWTNSWSRNPLYSNMISIGASKLVLTLDVTTKRRVFRINCDSDVFAQEFSWSNPVLYNGSRDGCIRTCDVRSTGFKWPVMCLKQGKLASITCIRVLHDENYLLSSGLNGSIKMWDLRARACVQNYSGHMNQITHGLPFYVDPSDTLIFAAGQDSVTRIWSVQSGELLHSIPFPEKVDKSLSAIPALCYSEDWGGPGGLPGLMYGAGDFIHFYSY